MKILQRCSLLAAVVLMGCGEPATEADIDGLKAAGDRIIAKLERYKKAQGRYPGSLKEVVTSVETEYGDWSYDAVADKFYITVGNYNKAGFMLTWDRKTEEWKVYRREK